MERFDGDEFVELFVLAPGEEAAAGPKIGLAGVGAFDGDRAEFKEAPGLCRRRRR